MLELISENPYMLNSVMTIKNINDKNRLNISIIGPHYEAVIDLSINQIQQLYDYLGKQLEAVK